MDDNEIAIAYRPLYERFNRSGDVATGSPLLAHYTSITVLKDILEKGEIWFSNPLLMSDIEEMRFGLNEGSRLFSDKNLLQQAAGDDDLRALMIESAFTGFSTKFQSESAFDVYVFCMSEHDRDNYDGLLSMWRGYGGQGKGAAVVFDTKNIVKVPGSPLIIAEVSYATNSQRISDLENLLLQWAAITRELNLLPEKLAEAAYHGFSVILTYALTTKHIGFREEKEWRVIYIAENDRAKLLEQYLGFHITARGVEPKLKYKIGYIQHVSAPELTLDRLVERIILGPSLSSPLAFQSVLRMLKTIGKAQFGNRLYASSIPFRPIETN